MKTPEQLKGTIRSMAAKQNLRAQEVLQMFLFERILERLANSAYKDNFILKGGLLISSMIGINERTTMDMDTTVRGIQMEEDEIIKAVKEILAVNVEDGIVFEYQSIEPIRDEDAYNNFRVHLRAKYGKIDSPMKIDVTTGDVITPAAIQYDFPMLFDEKTVPVMAYVKTLAATGKGTYASKMTPGIRFMTSDTGVASAKVSALLVGTQHPILIGKCVAVDHRHQSKISDFTDVLNQLFAQFGDMIAKLEALLDITLDYPVNAMTRICKKLSLPKKAAVEAISIPKSIRNTEYHTAP